MFNEIDGDLVLRKVLGTAKNLEWGKLGPNWEGPYRITSMVGIGAYFLEDLDKHIIPRPWNVNNLKMQYVHLLYKGIVLPFIHSIQVIK